MPWQCLAMDIGDKIRTGRREAKLSQRELARRVGVSPGAVAQWEGGGGGKGISTANLVKLAAVLEMDIETILAQANDDAPLTIVDSEEKAAIHMLRALDKRLKGAHIKLLFAQLAASGTPDQERDPTERLRVVS